jgi:hypothetical protein
VIVGEDVQVSLNSFFGSAAAAVKNDFSEAASQSQSLENFLASAPSDFVLEQNYPNPFNPSTTIHFSTPKAGEAMLGVYNLKGQLIRVLYFGPVAAGRHSVVWDGADAHGVKVASGIYLYRLDADGFSAARKLILTK